MEIGHDGVGAALGGTRQNESEVAGHSTIRRQGYFQSRIVETRTGRIGDPHMQESTIFD